MKETFSQEYYRTNYRRICDAAMELGDIMLASGAETHRVEDTICRILHTTGFVQADAYVSLTGIIIGLNDPSISDSITLIRRITQRSTHMGRISMANALSRRFVAGTISIDTLLEEAASLRTKVSYPAWMIPFIYSLVSAAFTFMFDGTPRDLLAAMLIGLLLGLTRLGVEKIHIMWHLREFLCAAALGIFVLCFTLFVPLGQNYPSVLAGCIMPLVPGMMLTTSFRDLVQGDYISGLARMMEAIIIAICVAAGVALVVMGYEHIWGTIGIPSIIWDPIGSDWIIPLRFWLESISSFIASLTFCMVFHAESKHLIWCGLCGGLSWFVYRIAGHYVDGFVLNNFLAALTASLLAIILSYRKKAPISIFFIGGILCLVPGYKIYQTMFFYLGMDIENGTRMLLETICIASLIAIAIAIHSSLLRIGERKNET